MANKQRGIPRERMLEVLGSREGALALELRRAIQERAGTIEGEPGDDELSDQLRAYVDKVAKHAYRVTDEDIGALAAKYSTGQIYEMTVAAAVGASVARREAALALVRGGAKP